MKELSIEEKAKRYDVAIEELRGLLEGIHEEKCDIMEEDIIKIFPELKEPGDEKIRKAAIEFVRQNNSFNYSLGISKEQVIAWIEKQGEQKPADKFEIGDLITNGILVGKIDRIYEWGYHAYFGDHYSDVPDVENWHKWTIQDAKDGDVLACNEEILLFKSYSVQNRISLYCWYNGQTNNFHNKEVADTSLTTRNKICPATKEQRDLLFQKMKEAGYEWDANKKELKKIEDEEYNGEDYGIDSLYHAQRILEKTLGKVDGYQSDDGILEHKCAISAVKKLYEQKPAWSEEDEKGIQNTIALIEGVKNSNPKDEYCVENCDYCLHWLNSIEDRYTWKPSDEQIKALEAMLTVSPQSPAITSTLIELYRQLKKLREE